MIEPLFVVRGQWILLLLLILLLIAVFRFAIGFVIRSYTSIEDSVMWHGAYGHLAFRCILLVHHPFPEA
jgi:hypothetical protein